MRSTLSSRLITSNSCALKTFFRSFRVGVALGSAFLRFSLLVLLADEDEK